MVLDLFCSHPNSYFPIGGPAWFCVGSMLHPVLALTQATIPNVSRGMTAISAQIGIEVNPRFTDRIDWADVLYGSHRPYDESLVNVTRLFDLRRSNLVRQAYSKRHHGGCSVASMGDYLQDKRRWQQGDLQNVPFNFSMAMLCLHGYTLWEQEYSSSVAVFASQRAGTLLLLLYEDIFRDHVLAQQQIAAHLGLQLRSSVESRRSKQHSADLCAYADVDCDELDARWGGGLYPCLLKQLHDKQEGRGWTLPMLPNGTVSLQGDCHPLQPLNPSSRPRRQYMDLYEQKFRTNKLNSAKHRTAIGRRETRRKMK